MMMLMKLIMNNNDYENGDDNKDIIRIKNDSNGYRSYNGNGED